MNFSDDRIIVSPDQTMECRDSSPIPTDIIIDIFSRLPAKSVSRYRFLSKFWYKVISSQYFLDLFAARSSARLQILFLEIHVSGISFFSASHPSEKSSDNVATTLLIHYPLSGHYIPRVTVPINGLVCVTQCFDITKYLGIRMYKAVIYNPGTGESLNLPTRTIQPSMHNFLGYDPTEKRLKVLSLELPGYKNFEWDLDVFMDSQVLTLETEEMSWRMIECCTPHYPIRNEICINGVLYYRAIGASNVPLIVCFDVRSETFKFMKGTKTFNKEHSLAVALINYHGILGLLIPEEAKDFVTGKNKSFEIWVLKDAEKQEWSKHIYILPPVWKTVVGETKLRFVGMIGTNEIVLSFRYQSTRPCFFYYNIEKNTIRELNIQGMEGLTTSREFEMFLNHVEDVSVLKLLN